MATSVLYPEDTCALREDPTILAIVERTSHDVDGEPFYEEQDWLPNADVPNYVVRSLRKDGVLPKHYVFIKFVEPHSGSCVMHEKHLKLVNRLFIIGDVVKKKTSDAMSGFVARTSLECTLLPVYPGLELKDEALWPPRDENILRKVPGEELRYLEDFFEGSYIIYHGWIGLVSSVYKDVTIRLCNKSVVLVEDSDEVCIPIINSGQKKHARLDATKGFAGLVHSASVLREQGKGTTPVDYFYPGQRVVTKKMNLRRGIWKFGAYNANVSPKGTVVNAQENNIRVTWLACNVYAWDRANPEPPPEVLGADELISGEIRAYDAERVSTQTNTMVGTVKGSKLISGDHVKLTDIAGAALKYSGSSEHGTVRRIPRTETQGYDMNVYLVRETNLKLLVLWQDGSKSEEEAKDVVPYLNSDEHEVWPGKIVASEADGNVPGDTEMVTSSTDVFKPSRLGIVQSTDGHERTAVVRWFAEPNIQILNSPEPVLIPGSSTGPLSQESSEVSCFEMITNSVLTKHRGDLVLVIPADAPSAQMNETGDRPSGSMYEYFSSTLSTLRSHFASSVVPTNGEVAIIDSSQEIHNWLGTIVDLGLDGLITVRLGALDSIRDVRVPIERITTLVPAGEEELLFDEIVDEEMEDTNEEWSEVYDSEEFEQRAIEERIEYEGGQRLDDSDGGDDMWMTDEEEDRLGAPPTDDEVEDALAPPKKARAPLEKDEPTSGRPRFSQYSNAPPQFAILDEWPPKDHHYIDSFVTLNATLMRRIRKEHKILQDSLPEGIWVRTGADRLDLIRVLIIGAEGTPYDLAPFVIDFQFPEEFPKVPPNAHFHSWTNGLGRINPNLYEDGKICLSLLGTWSGEEKHESWSETGSSMLQVIVSLLGLVLVKEPYYNEAGYETLAGSQDYKLSAHHYSERVVVMSKGFIVHALSNEIAGLSDILAWLYKASAGKGPELLRIVLDDATRILQYSERARQLRAQNTGDSNAMEVDEEVVAGPYRLSAGAMIMFRKYVKAMEGCLEKCGFSAMQEAHGGPSGASDDVS